MGASYDGHRNALITEADRIADLADLAARTAADGASKSAGTPVAECFHLAITRLRVVADNMRALARDIKAGVAA